MIEPKFWEVTWRLEDESFEVLQSNGEELTFEARETIISEGAPAEGMYLVLSGFALVMVRDPKSGASRTIGIVEQGQSFGELGLLIRRPHMATVIAGTDLRVLKITPDVLLEIESEAPQVSIALYKKLASTLAERIANTSSALVGLG
jgi:CRP-like cAMP-binding protein